MLIQALDQPRRMPTEVDFVLLWSALFLLFFGMVMVYSASIAIAEAGRATGYQPAYYLTRHAVFLTIGLIAAAVAFQVPLKLWQRCAPMLFMVGVVLLAIVLIPGIGRDVNGARRWLPATASSPALSARMPTCTRRGRSAACRRGPTAWLAS